MVTLDTILDKYSATPEDVKPGNAYESMRRKKDNKELTDYQLGIQTTERALAKCRAKKGNR
jgi:hypothetical protein